MIFTAVRLNYDYQSQVNIKCTVISIILSNWKNVSFKIPKAYNYTKLKLILESILNYNNKFKIAST